MKKQLLLTASFLALGIAANAQVKIGTNPGTIDPSSVLELEGINKAFYINRVSLTGTNDITTVPTPKAGMMVYNTNTSAPGATQVKPALYYFTGVAGAGGMWVSTDAATVTSGLAWLLLGNLGTNDGINYLGTNDQMAMNFRVNAQKSGRIEYGNSFITVPGGTPQYANVAFGFGSQFFNAPAAGGAGSFNTSVGNYTLGQNTSGRRNTAMGYDALGANTSGDTNSAFGFGALQVNTTGNNNTGTGAYSLNHNTIGAHNTAVGYEALHTQVSDSGNTSVGAYSLYNNLGGKGNVAMGLGAMFGTTTGDSNTVVGTSAGALNSTGSNNTYLGFQSNGLGINLRWTGAVGSQSMVTVNNGLVLGATDAGGATNTSITPAAGPFNSSYVGINVTDPTQRIDFRNGHIRNRQDVLPLVGTPLPSGNGVTGASMQAGSSDVRGRINTVGYNNANGITQIRVNFAYACSNPPIVVITPSNESASTATYFVTSDTFGFDLFFRNVYSGGNASGPTASFNYHVIE